jgi:hypothetical protein
LSVGIEDPNKKPAPKAKSGVSKQPEPSQQLNGEVEVVNYDSVVVQPENRDFKTEGCSRSPTERS